MERLPEHSRSSQQRRSLRKGVIRNFAKLIKKRAMAQEFSCEFCEISKNTFSHKTPPVTASEDIHTESF